MAMKLIHFKLSNPQTVTNFIYSYYTTLHTSIMHTREHDSSSLACLTEICNKNELSGQNLLVEVI
jgi:hypothetical protein